jgi:hypothetical protein
MESVTLMCKKMVENKNIAENSKLKAVDFQRIKNNRKKSFSCLLSIIEVGFWSLIRKTGYLRSLNYQNRLFFVP